MFVLDPGSVAAKCDHPVSQIVDVDYGFMQRFETVRVCEGSRNLRTSEEAASHFIKC